MSATASKRPTGSVQGMKDLKMVFRQVRYEQLSFWLNPIGAFFTIGFSTIFLVMLGAIAGHSTTGSGYGNVKLVQYYLGGFVSYGIMAACFTVLAQSLVNRREMGLLKRLRLSPLPTWALLSAVFGSTILIAIYQVVILLVVGRLGFGTQFPSHILAFVLTAVVGMLSFTGLGVGVSTLAPNADAAGPIVSIVFFLLLAFSGLWFPIKPGTTLANVSGYFPVRHLITAVLASFNVPRGADPWAWHDLVVMAIWGAIGIVIGARRWRWSPRRG
ncbi:MAG: ABC transporter permease [Acidimicrobiales bacterium]|jgi:ABC-2 type transport system permease protein